MQLTQACLKLRSVRPRIEEQGIAGCWLHFVRGEMICVVTGSAAQGKKCIGRTMGRSRITSAGVAVSSQERAVPTLKDFVDS